MGRGRAIGVAVVAVLAGLLALAGMGGEVDLSTRVVVVMGLAFLLWDEFAGRPARRHYTPRRQQQIG